MQLLWKRFTDALVTRFLRMASKAVIVLENDTVFRVKNDSGQYVEFNAGILSGFQYFTEGGELDGLYGLEATGNQIDATCHPPSHGEAVVLANTIGGTENGKTFYLSSVTGFASTLPAPFIGAKYKFVVATVPTSGNHTIVTSGSANIIDGSADVNSTRVLADDEDSINFIQSTCLPGDWVEVVSNGTNWFVNGASGATGGITFTAA